ncbi:zinc finger protein ZAT1-like [Senna tora]|uniref:Zinc finger protein ZAT1-like n=1 Tax=Senna tora TaxID=362788 RepID=A0A834WQ73_9FABA|nr:zinc finger protein ZAT1-like [Senna tora]
MALIVDHQSNLKHFCKICKKGFGCGRALGGHMRAHGIGDESGAMDDDEDDPASDWEDKIGGPSGSNAPPLTTNKRMYSLRTNPNRLKSCRACENCGKEFLSWKSFLEHGKCTSDDADESPASSPPDPDDDDITDQRGYGWSKRKRSLRAATKVNNFNVNPNCGSSNEEVDLANCLMMLSNATGTCDPFIAEPEESCASASRDEERRPNPMTTAILARIPLDNNNKAKGVVVNKALFECKACKKVFNSHQALGGHRASHKKVKGCYAARLDTDDVLGGDDDVITHEDQFFPTKSNSTLHFDQASNAAATLLASSSKRKSKVHECSICHRVFSSGQALGGHKRCHWITSNAPDTSTLARFQQLQDHMVEQINNHLPKFDDPESFDLKLDLNLPAPSPDLANRRDLSFVNIDNNQNHNHHRLYQRHQHEMDNDNDEDCRNNNNNNNNNNINVSAVQNVDDEADSKVKLAKLSELKDMNVGSSSPWLQVGIGSTGRD